MSTAETLNRTLSYCITALTNCSLYSMDHHAVDEFSKKMIASMQDLFSDGSLSFALFSETFLYNDMPVTENIPHAKTLMKKLRHKGVEKLVIKEGVTTDELKILIAALASREGKVSSSDNITVGTFDVKLKSDVELKSRILNLVQIFGGVSSDSELSVFELSRMVEGFMVALEEETRFMNVLEPLVSYSEYTYVHSINVSLITIRLAESLGLRGENLHDAGIAGLLHDVGKMFIRKEVVEKEGSLTPPEWDLMKLHPIKGALYLSKIQEMPKIAAMVAFEHHMRYDGKGYPGIRWRYRGQSLLSGIVAIADIFDAMRSMRTYRQNQKFYTNEVTALIRQGGGTYFDPQLVESVVPLLEEL